MILPLMSFYGLCAGNEVEARQELAKPLAVSEGEVGSTLSTHFYQFLMKAKELKSFGLKPTSRLKGFNFKFISVPTRWIKTARQYILNIYTKQNAYATVFGSDYG